MKMISNSQHNVIWQILRKVSVQTLRHRSKGRVEGFFLVLVYFRVALILELKLTRILKAPFTLCENQSEAEIEVVLHKVEIHTFQESAT